MRRRGRTKRLVAPTVPDLSPRDSDIGSDDTQLPGTQRMPIARKLGTRELIERSPKSGTVKTWNTFTEQFVNWLATAKKCFSWPEERPFDLKAFLRTVIHASPGSAEDGGSHHILLEDIGGKRFRVYTTESGSERSAERFYNCIPWDEIDMGRRIVLEIDETTKKMIYIFPEKA